MSTLFDLSSLPVLEVGPWRAEVVQRLGEHQRLVTLFARKQNDDAILTAVFEVKGALQVSRCVTPVSHGYHELTTTFPALHCFEREMHEQTGLRLAGHPWLKPIRFEGQDQAAMNGYPYYRIDGKEVHEVAVGPIHAGVIEPGSFRFMCMGEQVHHLEIQLGYQHRGVEKRLLGIDPRRLTPLVETISGDTSIAHAWAFCAALEQLAGVEIDENTELARAFVLELERVAMHLAGLSGLSADVGFLQGASTYGRLRTTAINTTMRLCGSRFGRGALRPGGVGLELPHQLLLPVSQNVELLRTDLDIINEHFEASRTVRHRLEGAGVLSQAHARELGIVGLAARASGVLLDARHHAASGVWHRSPIPPVVVQDGDCQARAQVRLREMDESLAWLAGRGGPGAALRRSAPGGGPAEEPPARRQRDRRLARRGGALPGDGRQRRAAALQGAGSLAAQLDGPGHRGAQERDLRLPHLQQELRPLVLRERPMTSFKSLRVRLSQGTQYIRDLRTATPAGHHGLPVISAKPCATDCTACRDACPTRAITLSPVTLDLGRCVFCNACVEAVPRRQDRLLARPAPGLGQPREALRARRRHRGDPRAGVGDVREGVRPLAQAAPGLGGRLQRLRARAQRGRPT